MGVLTGDERPGDPSLSVKLEAFSGQRQEDPPHGKDLTIQLDSISKHLKAVVTYYSTSGPCCSMPVRGDSTAVLCRSTSNGRRMRRRIV